MSLEQSQYGRNAVLGSALSMIAAYGFVVVSGIVDMISSSRWSSFDPMDLFIGGPVFVLAFTFWIVIPIGAVLGFAIPWIVKKQSAGHAVLFGMVLGVHIGLLCAGFGAGVIANVTSFSSDGPPENAKWWGVFWKEFASLAPLTTVYSSIWTSGYALITAGNHEGKLDDSTK